MTSYENLTSKMNRLSRIQHALSILSWDSSVMMSECGASDQAQTMGELILMYKEQLEDPRINEWMEICNSENLSEWQQANLKEFKRMKKNKTCLDSDLITKQSQAHSDCEMAWRKLRPENNWQDFLPYLKKVIELGLEEATQRRSGSDEHLYDSMLNIYDPGSSVKTLDKVLGELKNELKVLLPQILEKQSKESLIPLQGPFKIELQKNLSLKAMELLGFDFNKGRLDVSLHPFCGGVYQDVRITTRYKENLFTESLYGVLHETGHALYDQNLPKEWLGQPVGKDRSISIHEGQSLFFEKQVGKSFSFLKPLRKLILEELQIKNNTDPMWSLENLSKNLTRVHPDYIRVDADEVTYPFHVILRYEIEKAIFDKSLKAEDIPAIWNEKMQEYLGVSTEGQYTNGCMQDLHWNDGSFGYFPSYTYGAMLAAQMKWAMEKANPHLENEWEQADLKFTRSWLNDNIWKWGSYYDSATLIEKATGETLYAKNFVKHLRQRYLGEE